MCRRLAESRVTELHHAGHSAAVHVGSDDQTVNGTIPSEPQTRQRLTIVITVATLLVCGISGTQFVVKRNDPHERFAQRREQGGRWPEARDGALRDLGDPSHGCIERRDYKVCRGCRKSLDWHATAG